jgi:hypothetical protein
MQGVLHVCKCNSDPANLEVMRTSNHGVCAGFHVGGSRVKYADHPATAHPALAPGGAQEHNAHLFWACPGNVAWPDGRTFAIHNVASQGLSKADYYKATAAVTAALRAAAAK